MTHRERTENRCAVTVQRTEGDFPHVRRRPVRLACCSCTSCCFTLLLAGVGGIAGFVVGVTKASTSSSHIENPVGAVAVGLLRVLIFIVMYTIAGLFIGAAAGFAMDVVVGIIF